MKIIFTGVSSLSAEEYKAAIAESLTTADYFYMSEEFDRPQSVAQVFASYDDATVRVWITARADTPSFSWQQPCGTLSEARELTSFITEAYMLTHAETMQMKNFVDPNLADRENDDFDFVESRTIRITVEAEAGIGGEAVANWIDSLFRFKGVKSKLIQAPDDSGMPRLSRNAVNNVIESLRARGIQVTIGRKQVPRKE